MQKQSIRNFSSVVAANLITTIISLSLALFIPKILPVVDYSYWQLYVFYASYVGIMHLGVADGIYLRYGGKTYNSLNKALLRSQFWILVMLQSLFFVTVSFIAYNFISDQNKKFIIILVAFNLIIVNSRTFLQMLLQTTNRITDYSKNLIYERLVFVGLLSFFLLLDWDNFHYILLADIVSKSVMLILLSYLCRDIVLGAVRLTKGVAHELWSNFSAGVKLMIANIMGMLILGSTRFVVEGRWGITIFGKLSLILAATSLVYIFITAAGLVMYPIIKKANPAMLSNIYNDLRILLIPIMLLFLLIYYPLYEILNIWLPNYSSAFMYLCLLFPLAFYEAKTQILTNTYLKAYRMESKLLIVNFGSLIISLCLSLLAAYFLNSLELTILSIVVVLGIRSAVSEGLLSKILSTKYTLLNILEACIVIIFVSTNWFLPKYSIFIYGIVVLCYLLVHKYRIHVSYQSIIR